MRALLSVYDKTGLIPFARELQDLGLELISTGGTLQALRDADITASSVAEITGSPEILGGRVKTLHPAVHAGLLVNRADEEHLNTLEAIGAKPIDLLVVNLYPFVQTVSEQHVTLAEAMEQVDVGGVAMIRAAAKNHGQVLVVTDSADYEEVLSDLQRRTASTAGNEVDVDPSVGLRLAAKAFSLVAAYDGYIAAYLHHQLGEDFPDTLTLPMRKVTDLRYGENPHQHAAFYTTVPTTSELGLRTLATARQLHGRELSFNNLLDIDTAWMAARDYQQAPCAVIVKHTNPCGLACHPDLVEAYRRAHAGDPQAAYGGIVGINRTVDEATATEISAVFYEAIVAPDFSPEALEILMRKRDLRLIAMGERSAPRKGEFTWLSDSRLDFKRIAGGFVVQDTPASNDQDLKMQVVTKRQPTLEEITDLRFAWRAVKHVKSNAIVLAHQLTVVGVGAGQMKRVDSVELAVRHARDRARGSVLASDAYFPFPDGVQRAIEAGVTAIIQPGGSIRDEESIKVADNHGIAMVLTRIRHFRH
ncbi:MAG TPA: bifunctional phosphoribosylaminoimidazolecarboxamide formyltransferase/IMP cyclohydrolase [Chloroflexota bacterium]|jgi:phosphoribosylaminoimidazolecarboxamide formyltransferase/IMP cyclohydrolase|nr:bifunctional phosphoribosylaminoimidazolecarboxamide formyltransferase/IMP cyclohydrolase [Chloroflexota bacterium]